MSDFLSRLLGRTIQGAAVLRARPQSLFERPRGAPPVMLGEAQPWPGESHAFEDAPEPSAALPAPTSPQRRAPRPPSILGTPTPIVPQAVPSPQPSSGPAAARPTVRAPLDIPSRVPRPAASDEPQPATRRRPRVERPGGTVRTSDVGTEEHAQDRRESPRAMPAISRSVRPVAPAAQRPRTIGDERSRPVAQRRTAVTAPRGSSKHLREVQHAAPTVHVTIGRLEVRATRPASAPARPAVTPAAPQLGLAEYLRSREEGR